MSTMPDAATLETVLATAACAPSAQNSQPWRWRVGTDGIALHADWSRRLGDTDFDRRDVLLGCGAVLDHCAVALADAGWQARIRRLPDPSDRSRMAWIELVEAAAAQPDVELANAIPRRRADRRRYDARPLPAGTLEWFHVRAARFDVQFGVVPSTRWARTDDGAVVLRYGGAPHGANGAPADDAAVVVLATEADTALARLRAGETLSRIVLSAASVGLATCPLTEPVKSTRDRLSLACDVFDGDAYPQALIRVGWAPSGLEPPGPVARRAVAESTMWESGR